LIKRMMAKALNCHESEVSSDSDDASSISGGAPSAAPTEEDEAEPSYQRKRDEDATMDALDWMLDIAQMLVEQPELFVSSQLEQELAYGLRVALQEEASVGSMGVAANSAREELRPDELSMRQMVSLVPLAERCIGFGARWGAARQRQQQLEAEAARQCTEQPPRGQHPFVTWLKTVTKAVYRVHEEYQHLPRLSPQDLAQGLLEIEAYLPQLSEVDRHFWGQTSAAVREAAAGEVCFYTPNAASPRVSGTTVMAAAAPVRAQQEASGVYAKVPMPLSFTAEPVETLTVDEPAPKTARTPRRATVEGIKLSIPCLEGQS
jgi:hypothetical protein